MAGGDLVLASASPRRAKLLRQLGVAFVQHPTDIDETAVPGESPQDYVVRLAREKALACEQALPDRVRPVLAADTCVVLDEQVLGKPVDAMDALAMLARLSGREHLVLTAVCLRFRELESECVSETRVQFINLQRAQVEAYIATGEPFDKAGAYAIQGLAAAFVDRLQGSYSGVVGLPLAQTWNLLQQCGVATVFEAKPHE
ncbi:MAG: Maf family protein [Gammaproteobacteria bacterium]|nr:Maf family protein [Gammaproteobacteria bacterium]